MKLDKYLQGLGNQEAQEESHIQVVQNPVVDKICEKYNLWLNEQGTYGAALNSLNGLIYSAGDVRDFSFVMKKYEEHNWFFPSGWFLSALINNCKDDNFEIAIKHLSEKIRFLGMWNSKQVVVSGNLEMYAGISMIDGFLEVKGSVENELGSKMSGGIIKVNGCAGYEIGLESYGGEIHVEGVIEGISASCKAKVYHKGKQIWPK